MRRRASMMIWTANGHKTQPCVWKGRERKNESGMGEWPFRAVRAVRVRVRRASAALCVRRPNCDPSEYNNSPRRVVASRRIDQSTALTRTPFRAPAFSTIARPAMGVFHAVYRRGDRPSSIKTRASRRRVDIAADARRRDASPRARDAARATRPGARERMMIFRPSATTRGRALERARP